MDLTSGLSRVDGQVTGTDSGRGRAQVTGVRDRGRAARWGDGGPKTKQENTGNQRFEMVLVGPKSVSH